ncbi:hypothetical protein [Mycobacteroides sp. LB1]|uniref:hypothetical protein n=1 Tax=Mycobacteroides sp. LB1 TaxID=2750814 RepID=UPI0015DFF0BE|nr:hypothetical protein [Mycobacteroides sp. LB1]
MAPRPPHPFNWGGLSEEDKKHYQGIAAGVTHMQAEAGQTQAKDLLEAKHIIDEIMAGLADLTVGKGFNDTLPTGGEVTGHYATEQQTVTAELQAASILYEKMADEFLAMEYAYLQTEQANAQGLQKWTQNGNTVTELTI